MNDVCPNCKRPRTPEAHPGRVLGGWCLKVALEDARAEVQRLQGQLAAKEGATVSVEVHAVDAESVRNLVESTAFRGSILAPPAPAAALPACTHAILFDQGGQAVCLACSAKVGPPTPVGPIMEEGGSTQEATAAERAAEAPAAAPEPITAPAGRALPDEPPSSMLDELLALPAAPAPPGFMWGTPGGAIFHLFRKKVDAAPAVCGEDCGAATILADPPPANVACMDCAAKLNPENCACEPGARCQNLHHLTEEPTKAEEPGRKYQRKAGSRICLVPGCGRPGKAAKNAHGAKDSRGSWCPEHAALPADERRALFVAHQERAREAKKEARKRGLTDAPAPAPDVEAAPAPPDGAASDVPPTTEAPSGGVKHGAGTPDARADERKAVSP